MGNTAAKTLNKKSWTSYIGEYGAFIALVLLVVVISIVSPEFRTTGNFLNLLRQATFNGLIAFGMTCVILSDGIDLSVGSTLALSAVICAKLLMEGVAPVLAMIIALISGVVLGMVSGLLVTKGRLQPFIATLITMTAYRGLALILTDGKPISNLAKSIEADGGNAFPFKLIGKGNFCRVPIPAILLIFALIVFFFVLNKTTFGRKIYATGSNSKCAKLVGVNITKTKIIVYAISGFMSALTGLILISRLDSAQPTLGDGYELDAIAAVALGGTSMSGGRGKITGTIAGVLIIAVLNNGMNLLEVSTYYQDVIKAVVILVAVLSDRKR